jgi:hypothetical protein
LIQEDDEEEEEKEEKEEEEEESSERRFERLSSDDTSLRRPDAPPSRTGDEHPEAKVEKEESVISRVQG